jgi:cytochrome c oxidase accessory protein FixG
LETQAPIENKDRDGTFRDSISTITAEGKRSWIYPKKPKGKIFNARIWVSYFFLIAFFTLPLIKVSGHEFMLFNVIERKFILFGIAFFPQDFFLFVLAMLTFVVFIALFTALFGRLWCGWACPQTIFMEMVFRRIEYFIEGDMMQQRSLDKRSWDRFKASRKILKHLVFFIIAFIISNTFLTYIIGIDQWKQIATDDVSAHVTGFIAIILFTGVFYGVYARFREQVCIVVCPYGRLQSVLLDPNSVIVAYDYNRGEPRGKISSVSGKKTGDCIDCSLCVQVCPTGIDIRNGTQLECINCTACIDACNSIMDKTNKPHGLIRYTSENAIRKGIRFKITSRIIGYTIVLSILLVTLITLLAVRSDIHTTILRTPGQLYQKMDENHIGNLFSIEMVNKTFDSIPVELRIKDLKGEIRWVGNGIANLKGQAVAQSVFFLVLPKNEITRTKTKVMFDVYSNGKKIDEAVTSFLGPNN